MSRGDDNDDNDWVTVNRSWRKLVMFHMLHHKETHLCFGGTSAVTVMQISFGVVEPEFVYWYLLCIV